jgi:hypothetical protein
MSDKSPKPASTQTGAVFLSYASQDAEAAQRLPLWRRWRSEGLAEMTPWRSPSAALRAQVNQSCNSRFGKRFCPLPR